MTSKLKAVRKGQKGAVSKLLKKFEDVKSDETTHGIDELSNIASALHKKVEVITELNEQILADLEEEEIEVEIPESDEYIFNLELKIQHVKRLIQTRTSRLNVHAASYLSDQNPIASNSTSTNAQPFTPQPPLVRDLVSSEMCRRYMHKRVFAQCHTRLHRSQVLSTIDYQS